MYRFLERTTSPGGGHDAELAGVHAAASGLKDVLVRKCWLGKQVAARGRWRPARLRPAPGCSAARVGRREVAQELGATVFRVSDDDRIRVGLRIVGDQRDVWSAKDTVTPRAR